jgi:hypothetical protein
MSSSAADFYLARAAENAKAAQETTLVNVRDRCLRAEAAWRTMADRSIEIERNKLKQAEEKAAREVL